MRPAEYATEQAKVSFRAGMATEGLLAAVQNAG
ncbi:hypothetical protein BH24ACT10_BH24ACT10_19620 [soil metagenome]